MPACCGCFAVITCCVLPHPPWLHWHCLHVMQQLAGTAQTLALETAGST